MDFSPIDLCIDLSLRGGRSNSSTHSIFTNPDVSHDRRFHVTSNGDESSEKNFSHHAGTNLNISANRDVQANFNVSGDIAPANIRTGSCGLETLARDPGRYRR